MRCPSPGVRDDLAMLPRSTTPQQGAISAPPTLVLVHVRRTLDTLVGTFLGGLVLIGSTAGNLANWSPQAGMMLAAVLIPAWLVAIVRAVRARVEVSPAGLRIRRVFSTRTIPAADYDGVTWNLTFFPPGASLAIRRKSGHPVSAPSAMDMREHPLNTLDDEIAELGQLIIAALSGPPTASGPYPVP